LRTVEDILLSGEDLEIGSDSDISDASQISQTNQNEKSPSNGKNKIQLAPLNGNMVYGIIQSMGSI
jgi:hypothetical protein